MQEKYEQWLKLGEELANEPTFHPGKRAFIKNIIVTLRHADRAAKAQETIPKDITDLPEEPRYENDCPHCVFLGHHDLENQPKYDLYFCRPPELPKTFLARFGNGGPVLLKSLYPKEPSRIEAETRARMKGLLAQP